MKSISGKDMLFQLKNDLIGKDSYRGVTLTYTWLANQFGHFSLGFIPTFVVFFFLHKSMAPQYAADYSVLIISSGWFLFEVYNLIGPLMFEGNASLQTSTVTIKKYSFTPDWRNITFDTVTDICFFWVGSLSSGLFSDYSDSKLILLFLLLLCLAYPCYYWYLTKMYIQHAIYPFQFRLSQWNLDISEANKKIVYKFLKTPGTGNHLLLFGSKNNGQNSLSVAIGTERAIKHQSCTYLTAMKLFGMLNETPGDAANANNSLWNWRDSSLLVIDDMHPGNSVSDDIITPEKFIDFVMNCHCSKDNLAALKGKDVVWVMGNADNKKSVQGWKVLFEKIGIEKEKIYSINLMEKN